jgi:hypothetical protein
MRLLWSISLLALVAWTFLATVAVSPAHAVTKLRDPVAGNTTVIHGVTNGRGGHRGPWIVQIAVAQGEFLRVRVDPEDSNSGNPTLRAIAGDGAIYFGRLHSGNSADLCFEVLVTGWMTVHIDFANLSEQRFRFEFSRNLPKDGGVCTAGEDPPH